MYANSWGRYVVCHYTEYYNYPCSCLMSSYPHYHCEEFNDQSPESSSSRNCGFGRSYTKLTMKPPTYTNTTTNTTASAPTSSVPVKSSTKMKKKLPKSVKKVANSNKGGAGPSSGISGTKRIQSENSEIKTPVDPQYSNEYIATINGNTVRLPYNERLGIRESGKENSSHKTVGKCDSSCHCCSCKNVNRKESNMDFNTKDMEQNLRSYPIKYHNGNNSPSIYKSNSSHDQTRSKQNQTTGSNMSFSNQKPGIDFSMMHREWQASSENVPRKLPATEVLNSKNSSYCCLIPAQDSKCSVTESDSFIRNLPKLSNRCSSDCNCKHSHIRTTSQPNPIPKIHQHHQSFTSIPQLDVINEETENEDNCGHHEKAHSSRNSNKNGLGNYSPRRGLTASHKSFEDLQYSIGEAKKLRRNQTFSRECQHSKHYSKSPDQPRQPLKTNARNQFSKSTMQQNSNSKGHQTSDSSSFRDTQKSQQASNNSANISYSQSSPFQNFTESLRYRNSDETLYKSFEDSCAEFLNIVCDNMLESVDKSLDSKLQNYCSKSMERMDGICCRLEQNECKMREFHSDLMEKMSAQNVNYTRQLRLLMEFLMENHRTKEDLDDTKHENKKTQCSREEEEEKVHTNKATETIEMAANDAETSSSDINRKFKSLRKVSSPNISAKSSHSSRVGSTSKVQSSAHIRPAQSQSSETDDGSKEKYSSSNLKKPMATPQTESSENKPTTSENATVIFCHICQCTACVCQSVDCHVYDLNFTYDNNWETSGYATEPEDNGTVEQSVERKKSYTKSKPKKESQTTGKVKSNISFEMDRNQSKSNMNRATKSRSPSQSPSRLSRL